MLTSSQPPPDTVSEALAQYEQLTAQVEKVNEDLLAAKTDLDKKNAALNQANQDLAAAQAAIDQAAIDEEAFRGQVDNLTSASFQGARFNKLSALLTGSSAEDFLERASALGVLAADNEEALSKLTGAVDLAEDAQEEGGGRAEARHRRHHGGPAADRPDHQDPRRPERPDRAGRGRRTSSCPAPTRTH